MINSKNNLSSPPLRASMRASTISSIARRHLKALVILRKNLNTATKHMSRKILTLHNYTNNVR
jgi:hypothetical protein